jgi:predicted nucleic acid-binding protein
VLTHRGRLVEARVEMNAGRIVSVGVGAAAPSGAGRADAATRGGEFRLGVQWIRATASERGLREEGQE